jgi:DnaJ family protein C protein 27
LPVPPKAATINADAMSHRDAEDDSFGRALGDIRSVIAQLPKPQSYRMKVISMGSEAVGKSCIIKRFCEERFIPKYLMTIGIDYGVKRVNVDGSEVRVNFWDLSGCGEFFETRTEFYKDAQAAILVYDVTNQRSFLQLDSWVMEANKYGAKDLMVAVCANKADAPKRAVSEADGKKFAASKGFLYFETSAQSGQNVTAMFEQLFHDAFTMRKM